MANASKYTNHGHVLPDMPDSRRAVSRKAPSFGFCCRGLQARFDVYLKTIVMRYSFSISISGTNGSAKRVALYLRVSLDDGHQTVENQRG